MGVEADRDHAAGLKCERTYDTLTERLTELVVIISLMGAGLKLDRPLSLKGWGATWRLLAIAMPLTIAATAWLGVVGLGFSVAMGVASFPHTAQSVEALLPACDAALAEARRRGGNHVTLASITLASG